MPENPAALHVVGVTGTGRLMHTLRSPEGWTGFVDVLGPEAADQPELQGYVTEVAAARVIHTPGDGTDGSGTASGGRDGSGTDRDAAAGPAGSGLPEALVVAVLVSNLPHPVFLHRDAASGHWTSLGAATDIVGARRISMTAANAYSAGAAASTPDPVARLHLAWTGRAGRLHTTSLLAAVPGAGGKPVTVENTVALERDGFRVPAVAGSDVSDELSTRLRLAGLTSDGRLYRLIVTSSGAAEVLGDVESAGAGETGDIVDTALAVGEGAAGCEYYAAVTGDGRILMATNNPADGAWTAWRDLEEAEFVLVGPGATMTYREVAEFGTFARVGLGTTTEGLHVLGVTTCGRLLHQVQVGLAVLPGAGQEFRDVELEGVGTDVGVFTAVAAA